jgi:hypothetical protein
MAGNLTSQVRNIADVTTAVAKGDLSRKITVDVRGEILELKNTINTMVDQLRSFAGEVIRVAREVGTEGVLGGQATCPAWLVPGRNLTDDVNAMANNLTGPGEKHRRRDDRGGEGRSVAKDHRRSEGRGARAQEHHQHDGGPALRVRQRRSRAWRAKWAQRESSAARRVCRA